jgi:hypothetical protein
VTARRTRRIAGLLLGTAGALLVLAPGAPAAPLAPAAPAAPAAADAVGEIGGYKAEARSHALKVVFDTPGALPVGPLLELTAPESRATLGTGGSGTAFSSLGYPGPVVAGLEQVATAAGVEIPVDLPPYPIQAAASTSGPTEVRDTTTVPGSSMEAIATDGHVVATTRAPALGLDTVFELGSLSSSAAVDLDGVLAVTATTRVGPVSLLGGLLYVEGITSTATATTDATAADGSASTNVVGATFLGTPVTIGPDGITIEDQSTLLAGAVQDLLEPLGGPNGVLAASGLAVRAGAVRQDVGGAAAVVGAEGLTVEVNGALDLGPLQALLDVLPPLPTIDGLPIQPADALGILQANQIRSVTLGQVVAEVTASPKTAPPARPAPATGGPAAGPVASPALPQLPALGDATWAPPAAAPAAGDSGPAPLSRTGAPLPGAPAGYVLLAVAGGLLASSATRRLPDLALASAARTECSNPPAASEELS